MEIDERALTYAMEALMDAHDANPADRFRWVRPTIQAYLKHAKALPLHNPDAASALSKAILEAHAKWQAKYQGVGHVG
jgi:hypothetical protein